MLMVAVVVDASAAYLRRSGLDSVADGAALAAAEGIEGSQVYTGRLGRRARIDPDLARRFVADYLSATGAAPGTRASATPSRQAPTGSSYTSRRHWTSRSHHRDGTAAR